MDQKQGKTLAIIFLVGYIVFGLVNWLYFRSTVDWPDQPQADSLTTSTEDDLHLTWDISGESGPPSVEDEHQKRLEEIAKEREQTMTMVDSAITTETSPLEQDVVQTRQDLVETQEQINELQNLLATLASDADSIDQANAKRLSKIVEQMKPADASEVLSALGSKTNALILLSMRQRNAARILASMPRERAAEIARYLSRAYARSSI